MWQVIDDLGGLRSPTFLCCILESHDPEHADLDLFGLVQLLCVFQYIAVIALLYMTGFLTYGCKNVEPRSIVPNYIYSPQSSFNNANQEVATNTEFIIEHKTISTSQ